MRRAALTALSGMGPAGKDAVPVLIEALNNQEVDEISREQLGSMAAIALGRIGIAARSAVPDLIIALEEPKTRNSAGDELINISRELGDAGATEMIPLLETAYDKLSRFEGIEKNDLYTLRLVIANLTNERWKAFVNLLVTEYPTFTVLLLFVVGLLAVYLFTLWLNPIYLLRWEAFWSGLPRTGIFKKAADVALFLGGWFCYRPRVLNAWVDQYMVVASQEFSKRNTVKNRAVHFSLPVLCDGEVVTNFSPENIRSSFEGGQGCVLILGEGGAGKTSLACQIAQWAMAGRLCKHRMIPVLIEEELDDPTFPNSVHLSEAVRGQLRNLLRLEYPIRQEFLLHLLIKKRVLVIIDHLSEMTAASRGKVKPSAPDFPANALVVTSRFNEDLEGVSKVVVRPLRLSGPELALFVKQYLQEKKKQDLLSGEEILEESTRLHKIVGKRKITVLLAKLYMDLIIARKEANTDSQSPNNVPELMVHYLNLINTKAADDELDDVAVQRFAKIVAWECLRQSFAPTQAARGSVLHALPYDANPERALRYLEDKLQLISTVGPEKRQVKFSLDPLAEYLAALHLVEQFGKDETQWREFLQQVDSKFESGKQIEEFLAAVMDCFKAKCLESQLPHVIAQELEKRLGGESVA